MRTIRSEFDESLDEIKQRLLEMASTDDSMIKAAIAAIQDHDATWTAGVIDADDAVDELDYEIEAMCMRLIALQQPVARDLRFLGAAIRLLTDLERIGDHAVDIARLAQKLVREGPSLISIDLEPISHAARRMLRGSMRALIEQDVQLALAVIEEDESIDRRCEELRQDIYSTMCVNAKVDIQASLVLFATHYLERIADHAVNIAERAYYVEKGKVLKRGRAESPA